VGPVRGNSKFFVGARHGGARDPLWLTSGAFDEITVYCPILSLGYSRMLLLITVQYLCSSD
jgi:hypothetical protein